MLLFQFRSKNCIPVVFVPGSVRVKKHELLKDELPPLKNPHTWVSTGLNSIRVTGLYQNHSCDKKQTNLFHYSRTETSPA